MTASWTCPGCGEVIPIDVEVYRQLVARKAELRVRLTDSALANAFAHAWTHRSSDARDQ